MENVDDVMIDHETEEWKNFVEALYEWYKDKPFSIAQLQKLLTDEEKSGGDEGLILHTLPDELSDAFHGKKNFSRVCGSAFRYNCDKNLGGGHKIVKAGLSRHAIQWKISDTKPQSTFDEVKN
jgi:hypothetical protein